MGHKKRSSHKSARFNDKQLARYAAAIVVVGILMSAAALFLTPEQTPYIPEVLGGPRIAIAQDVVNFGDVPVNKPVQAVFHVRNIGDQTLRFFDNEPPLEVVEGCCPPRTILSSTVLQPGQEATVTVQFTMHPGMDGPHDFRIYLRSNDPQEPEKELQILSNWVS